MPPHDFVFIHRFANLNCFWLIPTSKLTAYKLWKERLKQDIANNGQAIAVHWKLHLSRCHCEIGISLNCVICCAQDIEKSLIIITRGMETEFMTLKQMPFVVTLRYCYRGREYAEGWQINHGSLNDELESRQLNKSATCRDMLCIDDKI